jgi:hypothetical protein
MDPSVRALNPTEEISLISGITIGTSPLRVLQVLIESGHIHHDQIINIIWHPGTSYPIKGLSFGQFRPFLSSMTIIAARGSDVFTRNPRYGCTLLATITPPGRNTVLAITWKRISIYQGFQNMIDMNKSAFAARHPRGSHVHHSTSPWTASETPRTWSTPQEARSTPSSSLTSSHASGSTDLERLSRSESSIATLQNLLFSITTRLDNQELKNANTDASITAIDNNVHQLKTSLDKHTTTVTAIAEGYNKLQNSMDTILRLLQGGNSSTQAQSGPQEGNRKC